MGADRYQIALISLGVAATLGFGVFLWRELYPEYKIYQQDYIALEKFRSTYTGEPPPVFTEGIKQIVIEREDKGPAIIDRCISCHVALQFPHFSPTKIARDINGNISYDSDGVPLQEPNKEYIWAKLAERIDELQDPKINEHLLSQGDFSTLNSREAEAAALMALQSKEVDGHTYDMKKVLSMHPLMGNETRPFEYHPVEAYGCVSCHNGNGRGLTTGKAHGPVFDGQYEKEFVGHMPRFLEEDRENDPAFARVFNGKPGHELLFQTSPLYVGALLQAKCMQCHTASSDSLEQAAAAASSLQQKSHSRVKTIESALQQEKRSLLDAVSLLRAIKTEGLAKTAESLQNRSINYSLPPQDLEDAATQLAFLRQEEKNIPPLQASEEIRAKLKKIAIQALGSEEVFAKLESGLPASSDKSAFLEAFLANQAKETGATGSIFEKMAALKLADDLMQHRQDVDVSFAKAASDQRKMASMAAEVDLLTYNYHRGEELYISQACYACHRIAGFSRGGVGPELTQEGKAYPWYVKQKIVWPQSDLKSSTMPNMKIDHAEVEDLLTFVLGQTGQNRAIAPTAYKAALQQWEAGRKRSWEEPITPAQRLDVNYALTVFATEGCAACHRLKGYESNVGYALEKEKGISPDVLYKERAWFRGLFPEDATGSQIVQAIDKHQDEMAQRISSGVREGSILESIEKEHPKAIESFYTPFKFAMRAKNTLYKDQPEKLRQWQESVHNILMLYIQEYGLGRLIGPRPNWSGVFRTDEWLMEHFRNPAGHVPRSIMPAFPFDDTKFYALTHMLDVLGRKNRDDLRALWEYQGFRPEIAFELLCAQCHGDFKQGNGPVAEWIYPIPKNLGDGNFLRHLTKENAANSIRHGVIGTPMPPWGEVAKKGGSEGAAVLNQEEIGWLVDWLYSFLPSETGGREKEKIPKWQYSPEDAIKELHREGNSLPSFESEGADSSVNLPPELASLPAGHGLIASLRPVPVSSASPNTDVENYFTILPNKKSGPEETLYYIKKKYYTPENIAEGKAFFEINCASCHGKEADGAGLRAEAMHDAKPRMLTNLDWINTRDDLRLLRSIKYGVSGTAMTPWGDFTSSLQRLQLVIFIRSLTQESESRSQMAEGLYQAFDDADFQIEQARWHYYPQIAALEAQAEAVQKERIALYKEASGGQAKSKEAVEAYENEIALLSNIQRKKSVDKIYLQMKSLLRKERDLFDNMGKGLLQNNVAESSFSEYLDALSALKGVVYFKEGKFFYDFTSEKTKKISAISKQLQDDLQQSIDHLAGQKKIVLGKISSPEQREAVSEIEARMISLTKLKNTVQANFEESARIHQQQAALYKQLETEIK